MNLTETIDILSNLLSHVWRTFGKGYLITGASEEVRGKAEATELELGGGGRLTQEPAEVRPIACFDNQANGWLCPLPR